MGADHGDFFAGADPNPTIGIGGFLNPGPIQNSGEGSVNGSNSGNSGSQITDTATNISSSLDALNSDPNVTSITLAGGGVPTLLAITEPMLRVRRALLEGSNGLIASANSWRGVTPSAAG
jgi:hypothetical protein